MGTVLSFANHLLGSGQWTASERSRLAALTERFFGGPENVQVVFGATDDGAPWCAVTNADDDVLVHVARVADQFLVHFVAEDVMTRGANLREALGQWLSPEPERGGVVVPFNRVQNGANVLVLLAVATFLEDQLRLVAPHMADGGAGFAIGSSIDGSVSPPESDPTSEAMGEERANDKAPSDDSDSQTATAQTQPDPVTDQPAPKSQPAATVETASSSELVKPEAPAEAVKAMPAELRGGDGDDALVGGPHAERLVGGPGNDLLIGGGGRDTLDGGQGDDRIMLTSEAVALGGAGADTFVISAPAVMGDADALLGTIFDFNADEGDRLAAAGADLVILRRRESEPTDLGFASHSEAGQRVEVDLNGDGRADGYVLLTGAASHSVASQGAVLLVGVSTDWTDIFG